MISVAILLLKCMESAYTPSQNCCSLSREYETSNSIAQHLNKLDRLGSFAVAWCSLTAKLTVNVKDIHSRRRCVTRSLFYDVVYSFTESHEDLKHHEFKHETHQTLN